MSATLDAGLFEKYFSAKVLYVRGRQFPVKVFYTPVPEPNYLDAMLIAILQVWHSFVKNTELGNFNLFSEVTS
jgi:HrpA-like RNA helicase